MSDHIVNSKVNQYLNQVLIKHKFDKAKGDAIKNECKEAVMGMACHLIQSASQNDSDGWFALIDIQDPSDEDFETFLDVVDKCEEIINELQMSSGGNNPGQQIEKSEQANYLINQVSDCIFRLNKI